MGKVIQNCISKESKPGFSNENLRFQLQTKEFMGQRHGRYIG